MKRILALITIVLMLIPAVAAGTIDGSVRFLKDAAGSSQQTGEISLAIMALSAAADDLAWDVTPDLVTLVDRMLDYQNPDGGWGFYPGEVSNVVDTAYAVVAFSRVYPYLESQKRGTVKLAIDRGLSYLFSAENDDGWGYVPGTPTSCYPTLAAIWALGENGYSYNSRAVRNAVKYVGNATCELPKYEALALKLIAYHSVGYPVSNGTLETVKELLLKGGDLSMKERAMLTYVLVLYAPWDFDTMRMLIRLESYSTEAGNLVYWVSTPYMFSSAELIATTSYALMALSSVSKLPPVKKVSNPYEMPCQALENMQNPDGGWGLGLNTPSDEKATYYALRAIDVCYPSTERVRRALAWTREAFERDANWMKENRRMSVGYYYALKTLLAYGNLTAEEKEEARELIRSVQLDQGLWGNTVLGPQPYDTALAVDALRELGVPANDSLIQRAKSWLLSVSNGGWGTYVTTAYYSYMLKPDVLTTITVLEALKGMATPEELKPHLEWLIEQRVDGGWPYWKTYYVWDENREFPGTPTVELTVRATDLLLDYGYNYTNDTLSFVMNARDSGAIDGKTIEMASAIEYLSRFQYIPPVDLYDVRRALDGDTFRVVAPGMDNESLGAVIKTLNDLFSGGFLPANTSSIGEGSYIVLANFTGYPIREYNPYLKFYVDNGTVTVGNITVPTSEAVVLVPGKTPEGIVLFVLYEPENSEIAREVFTTGFIRYIRGHAMVLLLEDGKVRVTVVG